MSRKSQYYHVNYPKSRKFSFINLQMGGGIQKIFDDFKNVHFADFIVVDALNQLLKRNGRSVYVLYSEQTFAAAGILKNFDAVSGIRMKIRMIFFRFQ